MAHRRGSAVLVCAAIVLAFTSHLAGADDAPRKIVEIYRIVPGQHEAFLKLIAQFDAANQEAGIPARDLYVHQDGANWDFMLIQNAENSPEQSKKLAEALKKRGLPGGAHFFLEFRKLIAEHTDTFVEGPTSAATWLRKLEP